MKVWGTISIAVIAFLAGALVTTRVDIPYISDANHALAVERENSQTLADEQRFMIDNPRYYVALVGYKRLREVCRIVHEDDGLQGTSRDAVFRSITKGDMECAAILDDKGDANRLKNLRMSPARWVEADIYSQIVIAVRCSRIAPDKRPKFCSEYPEPG